MTESRQNVFAIFLIAIQVVEFPNRGYENEKNQQTQRKLLNFENWVNATVRQKLGIHFRVVQKLKLEKNVFTKNGLLNFLEGLKAFNKLCLSNKYFF